MPISQMHTAFIITYTGWKWCMVILYEKACSWLPHFLRKSVCALIRRQWHKQRKEKQRAKPWGATDSVGGGSQTAVTPHRDKSAALGAKSRYHCFLQLSQLKPWNFKSGKLRIIKTNVFTISGCNRHIGSSRKIN